MDLTRVRCCARSWRPGLTGAVSGARAEEAPSARRGVQLLFAPRHSVGPGGLGNALQLELAAVVEAERLADAQLAYAYRHGNVTGGRGGAKPGGELHRGAEQIVVVVGHRLPGADAD